MLGAVRVAVDSADPSGGALLPCLLLGFALLNKAPQDRLGRAAATHACRCRLGALRSESASQLLLLPTPRLLVAGPNLLDLLVAL